MNSQKLACVGLVLSIFAALGTVTAQLPAPDSLSLDYRIPAGVGMPEESGPLTATAELNLAVPTATWVQSAGPETGNPFAFLRRGGRLWMGTFGGLWVSDDDGDNWTLTDFQRGFSVSALAANSTTIFLVTNAGPGAGVYRSTDEGQTWLRMNSFPASRTVQELLVNGATLFAVTFNGELFRSTDSGDSWTRLSDGLPNAVSVLLSRGLVLSNNVLFLLNFAANPPELYRSTDNGDSWTRLNPPLPLGARLGVAANSSKVFLGTTQGLLVSSDGGQTWQTVSGLPSGSNVNVQAFVDGTTVYATWFNSPTEATVYVSTDNGATWTAKSKLPFSNAFYDFLVEGPTVFFGHPSGVIRLNDSGASFEFKNRGLRSAITFSEILVLGNRSFVSSHGGGLWVTTDHGANWQQLKNGLPAAAFVSAVGAVGNTLYAALEQPFGLYRSTDFGETWTPLGNGLPPTNSTPSAIAANSGRLYLGFTNRGLWASMDNGENWAQVTGGISATANIAALAFKDNTIFVATEGTGAFRSMDGGANFTPINTGLTTQFTGSLLVAGDRLFLTASNGVYRSVDNGNTWTRVLANSFYETIVRSNTAIYVAGGAGVYMSRDNGETWQVNNSGLFGQPARLAISGERVILATLGSGVFFQLEDAFAAVSAASFSPNAVADKAIVSVFGAGLATSTALATALPLPTTLAGTSINVRDSAGSERPSPLFFVSPGQINFQMPAGTAPGTATITVTTGSGATITGTADIKPAAPSIFTTNASGTGAAAAVDAFTGALSPFSATQANEQPNIIAVFGTGLGGDATDVDANVNTSVTARIGGAPATVLYAGRASGFVGLNQFNLQLPAKLAAGTHTLTITRGGVTSNNVTIAIR